MKCFLANEGEFTDLKIDLLDESVFSTFKGLFYGTDDRFSNGNLMHLVRDSDLGNKMVG